MSSGATGAAAQADPARLYVWLLLPMLLISAQYGVRILLLFTCGTALLEILLASFLVAAGGPPVTRAAQDAGSRFLFYTVAGLAIVALARAQRRFRQEQAQRQAERQRSSRATPARWSSRHQPGAQPHRAGRMQHAGAYPERGERPVEGAGGVGQRSCEARRNAARRPTIGRAAGWTRRGEHSMRGESMRRWPDTGQNRAAEEAKARAGLHSPQRRHRSALSPR
jgi:hypothetical protein